MRTYKKKTERGSTSKEDMEEALNRVAHNKESIRSVAKALNICHVTLSRYVKKVDVSEACIKLEKIGYNRNPVFNDQQSASLAEYVRNASKIYFGLTPKELRKLGYECALHCDIQIEEKRKILMESDNSSEDKYFCLVCTEAYSNSKPNECWIMCNQCKMWSHESCTVKNIPYICHNCNSDSE